jgi:Ca2+-binding EF-hand superfamily protein
MQVPRPVMTAARVFEAALPCGPNATVDPLSGVGLLVPMPGLRRLLVATPGGRAAGGAVLFCAGFTRSDARRLFDAIDTDGSGAVSARELREAVAADPNARALLSCDVSAGAAGARTLREAFAALVAGEEGAPGGGATSGCGGRGGRGGGGPEREISWPEFSAMILPTAQSAAEGAAGKHAQGGDGDGDGGGGGGRGTAAARVAQSAEGWRREEAWAGALSRREIDDLAEAFCMVDAAGGGTVSADELAEVYRELDGPYAEALLQMQAEAEAEGGGQGSGGGGAAGAGTCVTFKEFVRMRVTLAPAAGGADSAAAGGSGKPFLGSTRRRALEALRTLFESVREPPAAAKEGGGRSRGGGTGLDGGGGGRGDGLCRAKGLLDALHANPALQMLLDRALIDAHDADGHTAKKAYGGGGGVGGVGGVGGAGSPTGPLECDRSKDLPAGARILREIERIGASNAGAASWAQLRAVLSPKLPAHSLFTR